MKSFSTPEYCGHWIEFDGDRMKLRRTIETLLASELDDPIGKLVVLGNGPHWEGERKIHLSYAHTVGFAILVHSDTIPLGVDVESLKRVFHESPLRIAERYFHPAEAALLKNHGGDPADLNHNFLDLWLKKEAYGKLTRMGLRDSIHLEVDRIPDALFETVPVTPVGYRALLSRPQP